MSVTLFDNGKEMLPLSSKPQGETREISPEDLKQFIELCKTCAETELQTEIEEGFKRHIGEDSTYTYKSKLKEALHSIYFYISNLSEEQSDFKNAIIFKINERVLNCTPGFHDGLEELLINIFCEPKNIEDYLALFRQDLVTIFANQHIIKISNIIQVHHNNLIFQIASEKYKTTPINPDDMYMPQSRGDYEPKLATFFKNHYQFFSILADIKERLISNLVVKGYTQGSDFSRHQLDLNDYLVTIFPDYRVCLEILKIKADLNQIEQEIVAKQSDLQGFVDDLFAKRPELQEIEVTEEMITQLQSPEESTFKRKVFARINEEEKEELQGLTQKIDIQQFIKKHQAKIFAREIDSRKKNLLKGNPNTLSEHRDKESPQTLYTQLTQSQQKKLKLVEALDDQYTKLNVLFWDLETHSIREAQLLELIMKTLKEKQYTEISEELMTEIKDLLGSIHSGNINFHEIEKITSQLQSPIDEIQMLKLTYKEEHINNWIKIADKFFETGHADVLISKILACPTDKFTSESFEQMFKILKNLDDTVIDYDSKRQKLLNKFINQLIEFSNKLDKQSLTYFLLNCLPDVDLIHWNKSLIEIFAQSFDSNIQNILRIGDPYRKLSQLQKFQKTIEKIPESQHAHLFLISVFKNSRSFEAALIQLKFKFNIKITDELFSELCQLLPQPEWEHQVIEHKKQFLIKHCDTFDKLKMLIECGVTLSDKQLTDFYQNFSDQADVNEWIGLLKKCFLNQIPKDLFNKIKTSDMALLIDSNNPHFIITNEIFNEFCQIYSKLDKNSEKRIDKKQFLIKHCDTFDKLKMLIECGETLSNEQLTDFYQKFSDQADVNEWIGLFKNDISDVLMKKLETRLETRTDWENLTEKSVRKITPSICKYYWWYKSSVFQKIRENTQYLKWFITEAFLNPVYPNYDFLSEFFRINDYLLDDKIYEDLCDAFTQNQDSLRSGNLIDGSGQYLIKNCNTIKRVKLLINTCHLKFTVQNFQTIMQKINDNPNIKEDERKQVAPEVRDLLIKNLSYSEAIDLSKVFAKQIEDFKDIAIHHPNAKIKHHDANAFNPDTNIIYHLNLIKSYQILNANLAIAKPTFSSLFNAINQKTLKKDILELEVMDRAIQKKTYSLNHLFLELYNLSQDLKSSDETVRTTAVNEIQKKLKDLVKENKNKYHLGHYVLGNFMMALAMFTIIVPVYIKYRGDDYWYQEHNPLTRCAMELQNKICDPTTPVESSPK